MQAPRDKCVLCSIGAATTQEHVPPQSFFERPYPDNLITVPACQKCNLGSHLDDEYFLAFLASREIGGATPTLEHVQKRVTRGLHRQGFPRLRQRLIASSELTVTKDPKTGMHELTLATRPESDRVKRTIQKQVRGIVYHLTGHTVPRSTFMMADRTWGLLSIRLTFGICS